MTKEQRTGGLSLVYIFAEIVDDQKQNVCAFRQETDEDYCMARSRSSHEKSEPTLSRFNTCRFVILRSKIPQRRLKMWWFLYSLHTSRVDKLTDPFLVVYYLTVGHSG